MYVFSMLCYCPVSDVINCLTLLIPFYLCLSSEQLWQDRLINTPIIVVIFTKEEIGLLHR